MKEVSARAVFSRQSDEWATPQSLFDTLNAEFGFTLDACATAENAKCPVFYTKDEDGLLADWGGAGSLLQSALFGYIQMG